MTANKSAKAASRAGGSKVPRDIPERCQSASPPPILNTVRVPTHPLSDSEDSGWLSGYARVGEGRLLSPRNCGNKSATLRSSSSCTTDFQAQSRLIKARSISCLDNKLSIYKPASGGGDQEQKENRQEGGPAGDGLSPGPFGWSTLSLGPSSNTAQHQRSLSLSRPGTCPPSTGIRKRISEWECRRVQLPRMSLCLDKRPLGERVGGSEGCPSLLSSPCSDKAFDFKATRRMSTAFSECSYPETEEEEVAAALNRDPSGRLEKRPGKAETTDLFLRSLSSRKETSAVLNRIQKIEQALKESPSRAVPQYPSSCYAPDKGPQRSFTIGRLGDSDSACTSKRSSISSIVTEPDVPPSTEKVSKVKQRFSVSSARSGSPELSSPTAVGGNTPVNPVPKPKRTFEYEANRNHNDKSPSNGLPLGSNSESPPPLPSTPAPPMTRGHSKEGSFHKKDRESGESEDAASLSSSNPSTPTANGSASTDTRSHPGSKSTLEENAYEDIVESLKENPYEDVDLKGRGVGRKSRLLLPESSQDSLNRMWTHQDRKFTTPPQLPSKPSSQSLRLPGPADRKGHRASRLTKRHSHDDMLLLPQLSVSPSLLNDSLSSTSDTLTSCRHRRVPKLVQRINSIYCTKRGKKRLKKLSLSNIETASLRDDNSESESDSDDRFKAHTQRLLKLQSMLRRAPSYRTLELQLIEWQERELFQYFVVVSLKKKPTKNSYTPEVTYQFPKLERPTKQMREAEQRLKAIPQFCFPDAKDWSPVSEYSSETFSFMLTGEDGSRRFGYCRRLLPSGKGPRLPEVYCVISRLGCFDLFSKILDEVERRREISAALVYPFMRSLMESPFPAPGKTIKVKTFLPGAGNEIMELRRPTDSRLEHVDLESLFSCLSVRQVVRVFASLLLERRVIFVADKLSTLSSCVHAVVALLYPFSWQHTFIPVLPASMVDIVCCPTPFLVGLLSSSLPKLKELPVEEALMVDLGTDRFIRQMDDEATLLPRKLQAALEQALEQRNGIINQDSDSESDEECNSLNSLVSEAFIRFFLETIGHYSLFLTQNERGERVFQREAFRKSVASKSIRRFLGVFMESQMFAGFIQDRELRKCRAKGLFEQRVEQYLEELPDTEQSGVNKFLKGLGSKMKFLHKKN
ncbi:DENN domain-containing protein 2B-like isoform X2 [Megalops cyprinoides]|nr:DENN domain-containing protein 2B-like isoform X2 [Megalops cyprinoides]XP_036390715.1 DENN domain-containing protein 2B-like isoform X2 [Megalops cyprinoides]